MNICVDVGYGEIGAIAAGVGFADWTDTQAAWEAQVPITAVAEYVPGEFYQRELPCLLQVLSQAPQPLGCVVIDGYVWLNGAYKPGLGGRLYLALGQSVPVIGVAKTWFAGASLARPVLRGESATPLYVTSAGVALEQAVTWVEQMAGPFRLPTLLKRVDRLSRGDS